MGTAGASAQEEKSCPAPPRPGALRAHRHAEAGAVHHFGYTAHTSAARRIQRETTWRTGEAGANAVILRSCPLLTTCSGFRIKRKFASASRSREGFHAGDSVASLPTPSIARARWCRVVPCRKPVWGVPGRCCAGTKPLGFTCAPVDVPGAAPLGEIADRRGRRLRALRHSSHAGDCRKRDRHCRMRQGCRQEQFFVRAEGAR